MKEKLESQAETGDVQPDNTSRKFDIAGAQDLPDTPKDLEKMQPEETVIDLPDVSDIPGQEHVVPLPMGELGDTTISSDDEEGVGIFDDEDDDSDEDVIRGTEADVTSEEKKDLQHADEDVNTTDETNLQRASLDNADDEGELLNEGGFGQDVSGGELDVPQAEANDANKQNNEIGEEDEENDFYSLEDDTNQPV